MDDSELQKAERDLRAAGLLARRRRLRAAGQLAADGSPAALTALARAYADLSDGRVLEIASRALTEVTDQQSVDGICEAAVSTGSERLLDLVAGAMTPSDPVQRAVLLFLSGDAERYAQLDFDGSLLRAAHEVAVRSLRDLLAVRARATGHVAWLRLVAGGRHEQRLADLSDEEWETTVGLLAAARRWPQMWKLVLDAPPLRAARLLAELSKQDWRPPAADERAHYERLVALASECPPVAEDDLRVEPTVLEGHARAVLDLAVSPDGALLASADLDGKVLLWELPEREAGGPPRARAGTELDPTGVTGGLPEVGRSGDEDHRRRFQLGGRVLTFTADGAHLAVGHLDGAVRLWDPRTGSLVGEPDFSDQHLVDVSKLIVTPDGALLAPAGRAGLQGSSTYTIRLWRAPSGEPAGVLSGHDEFITALTTTPDSSLLISAARDRTVRLWRLPSGEPLGVLSGHDIDVLSVSPDGSLLAGAGAEGVVRLWRLPSGEPAGALSGSTGHHTSLEFTPDGRLLAAAGWDGTIRLWRIPSGTPAGRLRGHTDTVWHMRCTPDGGLLASASDDGTARLWRLPSGAPAMTLDGHSIGAPTLAITPDGTRLISNETQSAIRVWDLAKLRWTAALRRPLGELTESEPAFLLSSGAAPTDRYASWPRLAEALLRLRGRHDIAVEPGPESPAPHSRDIEIDE